MLTVCAKDRRRILAAPAMHNALRASWLAAGHWLVGRYIIMPDHLHLFCAPGTTAIESLARWVRFWKATVTKKIGAAPGEVWQRDFWDTQLRRGDNYDDKWEYLRANPVRAGLVAAPELWPYQGELCTLYWHD